MAQKIVFLHNVVPQVVQIIQAKAPQGLDLVVLSQKAPEAEQAAAVREADFLLLFPGEMSPALWDAAKKVKLINVMSAGYDRLDVQKAAQLGIPVANNGGANSRAVSDHAMLLMLAVYRRILDRVDNVRSGQWARGRMGLDSFELADKTLGIVGLGNIGRMVARRARGFEMNLQYYDVFRAPAEVEREFHVAYIALDDLLRTSDAITLHVPLHKGSRSLIGERELGTMKKSAIIINTSRGPVIDEAALIAALKDGKIAGAGLDVLTKEPTEPDNPLLKMDNVVVTPHCAGITFDTWARRAENCFANIVRVANGQPPLWVVQFTES